MKSIIPVVIAATALTCGDGRETERDLNRVEDGGRTHYLFNSCIELFSGEACAVVVEHEAPSDFNIIMLTNIEGGSGQIYQTCAEEGPEGLEGWFEPEQT